MMVVYHLLVVALDDWHFEDIFALAGIYNWVEKYLVETH